MHGGLREHGRSFESVDRKGSFAPYDAVVIVTDHTGIDYARMVKEAQVIVDTRNATRPYASGATAKITIHSTVTVFAKLRG